MFIPAPAWKATSAFQATGFEISGGQYSAGPPELGVTVVRQATKNSRLKIV